MAGRTCPDLILMDINLKGGMDGITVTENISVFCKAPVIYITAYSNEGIKERAMKTSPVAFLIKPFREQELYSSIEKAFNGKNTSGASPSTLTSEKNTG